MIYEIVLCCKLLTMQLWFFIPKLIEVLTKLHHFHPHKSHLYCDRRKSDMMCKRQLCFKTKQTPSYASLQDLECTQNSPYSKHSQEPFTVKTGICLTLQRLQLWSVKYRLFSVEIRIFLKWWFVSYICTGLACWDVIRDVLSR